ncbi:hypothetical protein Hanom_Chr00s106869g01806141 [Helianthus anomalus]
MVVFRSWLDCGTPVRPSRKQAYFGSKLRVSARSTTINWGFGSDYGSDQFWVIRVHDTVKVSQRKPTGQT